MATRIEVVTQDVAALQQRVSGWAHTTRVIRGQMAGAIAPAERGDVPHLGTINAAYDAAMSRMNHLVATLTSQAAMLSAYVRDLLQLEALLAIVYQARLAEFDKAMSPLSGFAWASGNGPGGPEGESTADFLKHEGVGMGVGAGLEFASANTAGLVENVTSQELAAAFGSGWKTAGAHLGGLVIHQAAGTISIALDMRTLLDKNSSLAERIEGGGGLSITAIQAMQGLLSAAESLAGEAGAGGLMNATAGAATLVDGGAAGGAVDAAAGAMGEETLAGAAGEAASGLEFGPEGLLISGSYVASKLVAAPAAAKLGAWYYGYHPFVENVMDPAEAAAYQHAIALAFPGAKFMAEDGRVVVKIPDPHTHQVITLFLDNNLGLI